MNRESSVLSKKISVSNPCISRASGTSEKIAIFRDNEDAARVGMAPASAAPALLNRNKHDRVVTDLSTHVVVVRSPILVDGVAGLPLYNIGHHAQIHRDEVSITITLEPI
jgi:hypothetical protein